MLDPQGRVSAQDMQVSVYQAGVRVLGSLPTCASSHAGQTLHLCLQKPVVPTASLQSHFLPLHRAVPLMSARPALSPPTSDRVSPPQGSCPSPRHGGSFRSTPPLRPRHSHQPPAWRTPASAARACAEAVMLDVTGHPGGLDTWPVLSECPSGGQSRE